MSPGWSMMDALIKPVASFVEKIAEGISRRSLTYSQVLLVTVGFIVAVILLGNILIALLSAGLALIPV
jgi:hypothetical protein